MVLGREVVDRGVDVQGVLFKEMIVDEIGQWMR